MAESTVASPLPRPGRLRGRVRREALPSLKQLFPQPQLLAFAGLTILLLLAFRDSALAVLHTWASDENWMHGFVVPLFAFYILFVNRAGLSNLNARPSWLGPGVVLLSLFVYVYFGVLWMIGMVQWWSVLLGFYGVVLCMGGIRLSWKLLIPLGYLVLAMPWADRIYRALTNPLRHLASYAAEPFFSVLPGVTCVVTGVNIHLTGPDGTEHVLNVANACSGMHMLIAMVALCVAMAFIQPMYMWQRAVIILASVPIAIFANICRVIALGLIHLYGDGQTYGTGQWHTFLGLGMLPIALGLILLLQSIMDNLFLEEKTDDEQPAERAAQRASALPAAPAPQHGPAVTGSPFAGPIIASGLILAIFAAGWGPATNYLEIVTRKERIELLKPLDQFPDRLGDYFVPADVPHAKRILSPDMVSELGTSDYVVWTYLFPERQHGRYLPRFSWFVTYYTGIRDSIPHVPEECYFGGGFAEAESRDVSIDMPGVPELPDGRLRMRMIRFENPRSPGMNVYVLYFFKINSRFATGRNEARLAVALSSRYNFYSKVEMSFEGPVGADQEVLKEAERFLQLALPVLNNEFWPDVAKAEEMREAAAASP